MSNFRRKVVNSTYPLEGLIKLVGVLLLLLLIPITTFIVQKESGNPPKMRVSAAPTIEIGVAADTPTISNPAEPKQLNYVYHYVNWDSYGIGPTYAAAFIKQAYNYNFKPVLVFYTSYDDVTKIDFNAWDQIMNVIRADGRDVWVVVEPDMVGYLRNENACSTTLKQYEDRFLQTKAPTAHLGYQMSPWLVPYNGVQGDATGQRDCWLASGGDRMEDIYVDVLDRDQETKGEYPWSAAKLTEMENWFAALEQATGRKIGVWQIPMGNSTCNNGARSNFVETWLTDAKLNALSPYVNRLLFGGGAAGQSANLSSEGVYDCGFFNQRVAELASSSSPTAPTINNVAATATTNSVTITWSTDQGSDSVVSYGSTSSFGSTKSDSTLVTSHSIQIDSLSASTTYYYKVSSTNSAGLVGTSGTLTFTTKATPAPSAPVISSIVVQPSTNSATINWITDQLSDSKIEYGTTTNLGSTTSDATLLTTHKLNLTNLTANTTYYYMVSSTNASSLTGSSATLSFKTAAVVSPTTLTVEAETMSLNRSYGGIFSDTNASAGKALLIWSNATASKSISTSATSVTVRARGDMCSGAPHMMVKLDGTTVLSVNVTSTTWADYSGSVNLVSGTHTLKIVYDNDYYPKSCDRNLRVDKITFTK